MCGEPDKLMHDMALPARFISRYAGDTTEVERHLKMASLQRQTINYYGTATPNKQTGIFIKYLNVPKINKFGVQRPGMNERVYISPPRHTILYFLILAK